MNANIVYRGKNFVPSALPRSGALYDIDTQTQIGYFQKLTRTSEGAILSLAFHKTAQAREAANIIAERHKRGLKSYVAPIVDGYEVIGFSLVNYGASKDLSIIAPFNDAPSKQIRYIQYNWRF